MRFVGLEILRGEQFAIRGDDIPLFQEENIARHEQGLVQLHGLPIALDGDRLANEGGELFDGSLGAVFLHKAERGVDHQDHGDDDAIREIAEGKAEDAGKG